MTCCSASIVCVTLPAASRGEGCSTVKEQNVACRYARLAAIRADHLSTIHPPVRGPSIAVTVPGMPQSDDYEPGMNVRISGRADCAGGQFLCLQAVDARRSRFTGASIAGLVVGAMGVFVFTVALRHWLWERRAGV